MAGNNSVTGRCWFIDADEALTTKATWILAIQIDPDADNDVITLNDAAGVRVVQIKTASENNSVYHYFGRPGIFAKGVTLVLTGSPTGVIYVN